MPQPALDGPGEPAGEGADRRNAAQPAPPILPLDSACGHLIRRAQQVHTSLWSTVLDGDLTGPQYALLSALSSGDGLDQGTAGHLASLDKSTAAGVVARLERDGWLRRDRDPADGRRNVLSLTRVARAALVDVTARAQIVSDRLLETLTGADREMFVRLLGRVAYVGPPPEQRNCNAVLVLPLSTAPGHLVRRAEQVHDALWTSYLADEVTPAQYALLCALALRPHIDQTTAGEMASLDKSSTADVVARLTRRGWIAPTRHSADRRRKLLALSVDATRVLTAITPKARIVQRELLKHLTVDQQAHLVELLRHVAYQV